MKVSVSTIWQFSLIRMNLNRTILTNWCGCGKTGKTVGHAWSIAGYLPWLRLLLMDAPQLMNMETRSSHVILSLFLTTCLVREDMDRKWRSWVVDGHNWLHLIARTPVSRFRSSYWSWITAVIGESAWVTLLLRIREVPDFKNLWLIWRSNAQRIIISTRTSWMLLQQEVLWEVLAMIREFLMLWMKSLVRM